MKPTSVLARDIDPEDLRRYKAVASRLELSLQAAIRKHIHEVAEQERLRERSEAIRAARHRSDRPSLAPEDLLVGLHADRAEAVG